MKEYVFILHAHQMIAIALFVMAALIVTYYIGEHHGRS